MSKREHILLITVVIVSFVYRFYLMTFNTFPPGSDIGLHESVIKSITQENTSLTYNYYHMGGGLSATNPGYHIFVSFITMMTGISGYLAHTITTSLITALLPLIGFLIVKRAWNEPAALIAAILLIFSAGDISMLCWGGYPNLVALILMALLFYLYLNQPRMKQKTFLAITSVLVAAIFLTHVFSALVFVGIIFGTQTAWSIIKRKEKSFSAHLFWVLPIIFGAALVSPYLLESLPTYFGSAGTITGNNELMKQALFERRLVDPERIFLNMIPILLFFVLSKYYKGKTLSQASVLSAVWILGPVLMTQTYVFGIFLDYERFWYFLYTPAIMCVALLIYAGSKILVTRLSKDRRLAFVGKMGMCTFVFVFILLSILFMPMFMAPNRGVTEAQNYRIMTPRGYEAIQWIKENTPEGSVVVANAMYGWWVSGFAQRPTLSAVDPQFLILSREFDVAYVARNLLETDYSIDNGLVQFKSESSESQETSFELLAKLENTLIQHPIFSINDTEINIVYRDNGVPKQSKFSLVANKSVEIVYSSSSASFLVTRENDCFKFTQEITIHQGTRFAEVTVTLHSKREGINFDWLHVPYNSIGQSTQQNISVAILDRTRGVLTQIVFPEDTLNVSVLSHDYPEFSELVYNLEGTTTIEKRFFVGYSQYDTNEKTQSDYIKEIINNNSQTYLETVTDVSVAVFDYQQAVKDWNVSYILVHNNTDTHRFVDNSLFNVEYKNDEFTIFKVNQ